MKKQLDNTQEDFWKEALAAADIVAAAYTELLKASDALADKIGYRADWVLSHVMPRKSGERRMADRILKWMEADEFTIKERFAERAAEVEIEKQRRALLERLQLTDEEKKLLEIEE